MNNSLSVRAALATAISKFFNGAVVNFRDNSELRGDTYDYFTVELPGKTALLGVSDDRLATLSNSHHIEEGHRYKDDGELSKILISEMERWNVLGMLPGADAEEFVAWTSSSASFQPR